MKPWPLLALAALYGCAATTAEAPQPTKSCIDFTTYVGGETVKGSINYDRFKVSRSRDLPIEIYDPASDLGLRGDVSVRIENHLYVATTEPYSKFEISYISKSQEPVRVETYDDSATVLQTQYLVAAPQGVVLTQEIDEPKTTKYVGLYDGGGEAALTKFCVIY